MHDESEALCLQQTIYHYRATSASIQAVCTPHKSAHDIYGRWYIYLYCYNELW